MAKRAETDWADRVKRYLKAELKRADVTYGDLAARLQKLGLDETEASVANKLSRGTFPATFMCAAAKAIGIEEIRLRDV
jgi:hypothetical protein